jgi:hypothetical protein
MNPLPKTLLILTLCCSLILACSSQEKPVAKQGLIDISQNTIKDEGYINLKGGKNYFLPQIFAQKIIIHPFLMFQEVGTMRK